MNTVILLSVLVITLCTFAMTCTVFYKLLVPAKPQVLIQSDDGIETKNDGDEIESPADFMADYIKSINALLTDLEPEEDKDVT